jgi:hypothetical protein
VDGRFIVEVQKIVEMEIRIYQLVDYPNYVFQKDKIGRGIHGKKKYSQTHKRSCLGDTQNRRLSFLLWK